MPAQEVNLSKILLPLGVELKTIPVDSLGRPLETTFVCVAPVNG